MANTQKIDIEKLQSLLDAKVPQKEIAKRLGVSPAAVSKAKKAALQKKEVSDRKIEVIHEHASDIVVEELNTVRQLEKINSYANELLDLLMAWNRGDDKALQVLESQVGNKQVKIGKETFDIKEFKFKDPRELSLKCMAEIRGQLKLQLEIFQALYDMRAVEEFQKEVLEAINSVDPNVKEQIIVALKSRRAVHSAMRGR